MVTTRKMLMNCRLFSWGACISAWTTPMERVNRIRGTDGTRTQLTTGHPHTAARETPPVVNADAATENSDQQTDVGRDKTRERTEKPSTSQQCNSSVAAGPADGRIQYPGASTRTPVPSATRRPQQLPPRVATDHSHRPQQLPTPRTQRRWAELEQRNQHQARRRQLSEF